MEGVYKNSLQHYDGTSYFFVWSMLQHGTVDIFMFVSCVETTLVMPVPHSFHVLCSLSWLLFLLHLL